MALESRPLVDTRLRLVRRCRRSCSYRDFQCTPTPESILIFRDPFRGKPPPCSQASRGANRCILTFYEIAANQAVKREADRGDLTVNLPPGNATLSMSHDCATQLLKLLTDPPTQTDNTAVPNVGCSLRFNPVQERQPESNPFTRSASANSCLAA